MKNIAVIGSTGSIGKNTLEVVRHLKGSFRVVSLAAGTNIDILEKQIVEFEPLLATVSTSLLAKELEERLKGRGGYCPRISSGEEGLVEAASLQELDQVIIAIVGMKALAPTVAAIDAGIAVGLANKEVLVSGGKMIMERAHLKGVSIIPIDSEHSALFQCLKNEETRSLRRIILTASGGPFKNLADHELDSVTVEDALKHPNWQMGPKVTIDSSTLVNKGLEMIEAFWLFNLKPEQIMVVIHPQSIIHSMVEWQDGSILAQMGEPTMIIPIQYAMTYPERKPGMLKPFDFTIKRQLDFFPPDVSKFPAVRLASFALETGKSIPCFMNACNEILVERFIKKEISWKNIVAMLEKLMESHQPIECDTIEKCLWVDQEARKEARTIST